MPTVSPAEVAATSSTPAAKAPRFQVLRSLSHTSREYISLASERLAGLRFAADAPAQAAEEINLSSRQPQELSTAGNPSPATSSETSGLSATAPNRRSIKIPHIRRTLYVFPDARDSISQAHRDRYPVLKDIFQRNIEETPKLSDSASSISYELHLCGSGLADALPSIVVFCPLEISERIESLLTESHIRSQFQPETASPKFVRFELFLWPEAIEMLAFHEDAFVRPEKEDTGSVAGEEKVGRTPWGIHITRSDKSDKYTATMSCMIQVGRHPFGLTTAHAFRHPRAASPGTCNMNSGDCDTDNEVYAMVRSPNHSERKKVTMNLLTASSFDGRGKRAQSGKFQVFIPPHENTSSWVQEHANLDWALLDLGSDEVSTYATAAEALPIADHLPEQCLDVQIITRAHLNVPATLYSIPSYIGGVKGSPAAEVWTVSCAADNIRKFNGEIIYFQVLPGTKQQLTPIASAIRKGNSGSMVVDAQSGELYGMVVAANPFGDIHIIPFTAILAQVKELFETQNVSVLKLPRHFNSSMLRPGLEANQRVEDQNNPLVLLHEGDEPPPEGGYFTLHQSDLEELSWSPSELGRSLSSRAQERTADLITQPKAESVNATTAINWAPTMEFSGGDPTPDPMVEFIDSTATGLTFSALEDVSSQPQPRPPAEDDSPSQPLTQANLGPDITPGLIKDIQAWLDGNQQWLHVAMNSDKASDMPFERNTTCHSSDGSLDFVFIPAQPSSFGRDALAIGTVCEDMPNHSIHGSNLELDEL